MKQILITGGSGLIGTEVAKKLSNKGHQVKILSRKKKHSKNSPYKYYYWNIDENFIEMDALKGTDYIVHLAGENISEKKWTEEQKIVIEHSRVKSAQLLYHACLENNLWPKSFISSSAIGYYGTFTSDGILTEESPAGNDFLALIGKKWESAADQFSKKDIRTVKIRTGVVLSNKGAAYVKLAKTAKLGMAAALGSGKQFVPWIHIDDIVGIFIKAIEDETMQGVYNGVAPEHITNKELAKAIAKSFGKSFLLPNVPSFLLRANFGEMSTILLKGTKIAATKIIEAGYQFRFPDIKSALENLKEKSKS